MKNYFEYKNYIGTVAYDDEDGIFHGKLRGINDLVLFEGASVKELKRNFITSVDDYIQSCNALGKSPQKTYKGAFNVRVSSNVHRKLAELAIKKGMKLNELVGKTLEYAIANEQQVLD